MEPIKTAVYHEVEFEAMEEAAAYVAALSRFLDSPRGRTFAQRGPVEIWRRPVQAGGPVVIYLNDAALEATAVGFGPIPNARQSRGDQLAPEASLVLGSGQPTSWSAAEAEQLLSRPNA